MKHSLSDYKALVFDCDGVILNSNKVKTEAFYNAAKEYGHQAARALVDYHVEHGGVSRFRKFEYFFTDILKKDYSANELNSIISNYAEEVRNGLLKCEIVSGLDNLREATKNATWLVASGGAQDELREIFEIRGLVHFFDGGIYGSPTAKDIIVEQQLANGNIQQPALFLGDSRFDHVAANQFDLDFVFITQWSEFTELEDYADSNGLTKKASLDAL